MVLIKQEDIEIKNYIINFEIAHFVVLCCIIALQIKMEIKKSGDFNSTIQARRRIIQPNREQVTEGWSV